MPRPQLAQLAFSLHMTPRKSQQRGIIKMQGSKSGRFSDDFCVWDLVFVISMGRGRGSQSGVEYLECLVPSVGIRQ